MKIEKVAISATITPSVTGADNGAVEIDLSRYQGCEFIITGKTVCNTTAPGADKTLTVNQYWSDYKITTASDAVTQCAGRKVSSSAKTIANTASATRQYEFSDILRAKARYLYLTYDVSTVATNCSITLTVNLVRVKQPNNNFI